MRLLIADLVRRNRWQAVSFGVILAVMFGATAAIGEPARAFGASLGVAFALGPTMLWLIPRPIWYLPVAKRDIWRAGWLVATLGVTLLTTAVKLAMLLVPHVRGSLSLASVALSSVYDFAYAGLGCGLVIIATRPLPAGGPWRRVFAVLKETAGVLLPAGLTLGIFGSMAAPHLLPTHWTDMTPRGIAALMAALTVAVPSYFYSPTPLTPTNRTQRPARVKTSTPRVEFGRLSGLAYLLVHETAWTLLIGGSMVTGSILVVFVAANLLQSQVGFVGFLRGLLLRLDGRVPPASGGTLDFVIPLIGFAVFITSLTARFPTMLRHLRVLPLGAARLNLLLVAWPAVTWLVAWTALLALHYVVIGDGVTDYHAPALLGLMGLSTIVQALTLRLSNVLRLFWFAVSVGVVPLLFLMDAPSPSALTATGASLITAAALLTRRALTRNSTYTPIGRMLGVASTPR